MEQQFVDFDNHIWQAVNHSLHELLEAGRGPKKSHQHGDPLVLSLSRNHEHSVGSGSWVQKLLPESGSEIHCCEDGATGSSNVSDTFDDVLHGVLVSVGICVEGSEILEEPDASVFYPWQRWGC